MSAPPWLALVPRDTVFVRDGRSFDAAANGAAQGVLPGPTTVAGAVGAAFGAEPAEVRGPVLARRGAGTWMTHFPAPADLVVTRDDREPTVFRLAPVDLAGQTDLAAGDGYGAAGNQDAGPQRWLVPPRHAEPVDPLRGWVPGPMLASYLAGTLPGAHGIPREELGLTEPFLPERRVGLAREDRRARPGFLYQATHLRPRENWALLAECVYPPEWKRQVAGPVKLGGRDRLADPEPAATGWPEHPDGSVMTRVLVYLATPGLWPDGWRLPVPAGARLVAAATGEPEPVATMTPDESWRRSRMLRWAVPAGSVYLLEFDDPEHGAAWAKKVHGTAYGRDPQDRLRTAGFGVVLTGAWT